MLRPFIVMLLVACCGLPGLACAADEQDCRNGSFPAQQATFGLAKVVGTPRTYLQSDTPPCPDDSAACRGRSYVVPGDIVITGVASGPYVCAFFAGRNGGSAGYVRREELAPQPPTPVRLADWVGKWRDGDNEIDLSMHGGKLTAAGNAFWPSANPPLKLRPGGPNTGEMSGTAVPKANTVVFAGDDPSDCSVSLTLLPPYLLASDNQQCGGMNVSFTGVYRKR